MKAKGEDIHVKHTVANRIHQTVFFIDAPAPLTPQTPPQRFRLSYARERMLQNVGKQCTDASHNLFITDLFPIVAVAASLF